MDQYAHHEEPRVIRGLPIPTFEDGDQFADPPSAAVEPEIVVEFSEQFAAFLLWLVCKLLKHFSAWHKCDLTREDVTAFAWFLHDQLPQDRRTEVP